MSVQTRAKAYGLIALIAGFFAAFPYFMSPSAPMNEKAWQIGILQGLLFFLAGWAFAKAYYLDRQKEKE